MRLPVEIGNIYLVRTMYKAKSDEILGQIVMRGNRIVISESFWKQPLSLPQEAHQGILLMKARLREKVWCPSEQLVKAYTQGRSY